MWVSIKRLSLGFLLILLASAVLLLSDWSRRKPVGQRLLHVAVLQHGSQPILDEGVGGIIDGLAESGFREGENVSIRRYNAENDLPTANAIAKEIVGGQYDLVTTVSTLSLQAVANANRAGKTKHVFALVSDPVAAGVGISGENALQHPPYLAGYGTMQPVAEAFQLAKRLLPNLQTVGVLWNPAEANSEAQLKVARAACNALSIHLIEANVDATSGVIEAVSSLIARDVQAIWIPGDVTVLTAAETVAAVARKAGIPVFTSIPGNARHGALFDLGANYHEVGRLAGVLAGRILHGTDPATVPVLNVMPQTLLVNTSALADLREPWRIPEDVLRTASVVGQEKPLVTSLVLGKTWKVNILEYVNVADSEDAERGMRAGLRDSGLQEGRDYTIQLRNAQGDMPTLSTLVDAAITDGADLLMTLSTPTLQAALQRARSLPIVFTFVADAIVAGAGRSNEDHLPNVTGVPTVSAFPELLDTVRECIPSVRRIGTLFVPAEVNSVFNKDQLAARARQQGIELVTMAANTSSEMSDAAQALCSEHIDAVVQIASNLTTVAFASITQAARRSRIPLFGSLSSNAHDGAAVVVARDYFDGGHEAGSMAARIIRGEKPADIPFVPLKKTRIVVNLDAARAMGLRIPPALVRRASEVIGEPR
jgi:ABC-type uncharacterized transport system substrate-binding protein